MPERNDLDRATERSETTDPQNPPSSVMNRGARRSAVSTFVGGIVAVFLIVGAVFAYRSVTGSGGDSELDVTEPSTIGTGGRGDREGDSPGGFDPTREHESTRDELEYRGAGQEPQGPMPGLSNAAPLTDIDQLLDDGPARVVGRRIDVRDVDVQTVEGETFVIRDGEARATVIAPGPSPELRAGQRVDVSGTVEPDGRGGVRIRATRADVK
jgi:hypothetical protein